MADFKTTLLTLTDDAFFELIRNYLGAVKTPFNKHDLISRLLAFIRRDEIQDRMISLIDDDDAELLTVIEVLREPSGEDLFAFLETARGFLDLHNHLVNLEDRLLIYRDEERIRLNPELRERLLSEVIHPSRLFHTTPVAQAAGDGRGDSGPSWLTDTLLASFWSYLLEEPEIYRADGTLRKRSAQAIAERLPPLATRLTAESEREVLAVDLLVEGLTGLGLVAEEGAQLKPRPHAWHRWARFPAHLRYAQLAGAASTTNEGEREDAVRAAVAITRALSPDLAMDEGGLVRMAAAASGVPAATAQKTVTSMQRAGLLLEVSTGAFALTRIGDEAESATSPPLLIQPNFELTVPAELSFADALFVAEVCRLIRHDTYPRFELTKERVALALRGGLPATHIADRLSELAKGNLPQNVAASLRSWEEEFQSIRLYRGVVLQVQESRRFAVEHSAAMKELITEEFAPGLYLLDEADVPAAQEALREAGVELVPQLPPAEPASALHVPQPGEAAQEEDRVAHVAGLVATGTEPAKPLGDGAPLIQELSERLAASRIAADQREELAARIHRKLILIEEQLRSGSLKAERTEAKGLDYAGKVRVIEQCMTGSGYLEIIERTAEGTPHRRMVEPVQLRKDEQGLILEARELPARMPVDIPVGKLSLVRRLRATLFRRKPDD
jgi:hypothetical protein